MITYCVKYRKGLFWKKIQDVKGDGFMTDASGKVFLRFFKKADETLIEIPIDCEIEFSKNRFWSEKERMDKDAGQTTMIMPR